MRSYTIRKKVFCDLATKTGTLYPNYSYGDDIVTLGVVANETAGDHKSPNSFEFYKRSSECLRGTLINVSRSDNSYRSQTGFATTTHFGSAPEFTPALASGFTNCYNDAVSQIFQGNGDFGSGDGLRGTIDLTIDGFQLGQLRNTLTQVRHGFQTLAKSYQKIVKHARRGGTIDDAVAMTMNQFGAYYLQWWYGIRPTLMTAQELAQELQKGLEDSTVLKTYRSRAKRKVVSSVTGTAGWQITNGVTGAYKARIETTFRTEIKIRCKPRLNDLQQLARFVSLNPAAWAYELTPWSFVLDWFWNFGGYIRDLETCLVYANLFEDGYFTNTALRVGKLEKMTSVPSGFQWTQTGGGVALAKYLKRTRLSALPTPKVPSVDPRLGANRLLAAAALLSQSLGRKIPFKPAAPRNRGGKPGLVWDPRYTF